MIMSEFAFFRFMSNSMLNLEEQQHKDEIIAFTEDVLKSKGIDCDSKISKMSEEQLKDILEKVRKLRRKKNNKDKNRQEIDVAVQ
jgi:hypothetical protein